MTLRNFSRNLYTNKLIKKPKKLEISSFLIKCEDSNEISKKASSGTTFPKTLKMNFLPTIYPSGISRAIASLDELPTFKDMPDGFFRVIVRIVKKINLRSPSNPIVASRGTLAEESGKSVETVHRAIKWLEERGLIERAQKARAGLRGSSSPLIPTSKLVEALLLTPEAEAQLKQAKHVAPASPAKVRDFVRVDGLSLPSDLAWIAQQGGISASAVLMLMRMAKESKQRLSDVVAATKQYLEPLKGRSLFSYLRKLLLKGQDFSLQAKEHKAQHIEDQVQMHLTHKAQDMAGQKFQNRDGTMQVEVDASGMLRETRKGTTVMRMFSENFLEALAAGRLIPLKSMF